jgi:hypothetical protein
MSQSHEKGKNKYCFRKQVKKQENKKLDKTGEPWSGQTVRGEEKICPVH